MNNYHIPAKNKWEFDDQVTNIFEDMLARSIPQYEVMRSLVLDLAIYYNQANSTILDLGCSKGQSIEALIKKLPDHLYVGLEISETMIESCQTKFKNNKNVSILNLDLRKDYPVYNNVSVVLSILTLQFIPIEYRQQLVQNIYDNLNPKGAFILVEKILGNGSFNNLFNKIYYDLKSTNGYSVYEIERKRLSLEGVLVPVTASMNEQFLTQAGFKCECFWKWCNFAGWIAIKS